MKDIKTGESPPNINNVIVYEGVEVFRTKKDVESNTTLKDINEIAINDIIYICLFDEGFIEAEIISKDGDRSEAKFIGFEGYAALRFSPDDRKCWVSTSIATFNTKGITKMKIDL